LGDFNDNYGIKPLNLLVKNQFIDLLSTKKYTGSFYDKYTYWSDGNTNEILDDGEVRDLDHIFVNYNLYKRVSTVFIDHIMPQSVKGIDETLEVYNRNRLSDHWALVAVIQ